MTRGRSNTKAGNDGRSEFDGDEERDVVKDSEETAAELSEVGWE